MKVPVVAAFIALVVSPCGAQTSAGEIEQTEQKYLEALNVGDAAMLARMSAEHAVLLPPNADIIEGREAIEKYWRGVFAAGLKHVSTRTVQVTDFGSDAVREIGRIHVAALTAQETLEGKYITVWRKMSGNWLLDSIIWNFTQPGTQ